MKWTTLLACALLTGSTFAAEGNGSTGGGHVYGNQMNPWFLQNTKTVNYCVEMGPNFAEISKERMVEIIDGTFKFWKRAFSKFGQEAKSNEFPFPFEVGSQDFIAQDQCDKNSDIKFQMGFLTKKQTKLVPSYKDAYAFVYRTEYDKVNLRSKGFVYIAAEEGMFRPNAPHMKKRPWSNYGNLLLIQTLFHEIGHIFGLQDISFAHSETPGLMSSGWVDLWLSRMSGMSEDRPLVNIEEHLKLFSKYSPFGCPATTNNNAMLVTRVPSSGELTPFQKLLGLSASSEVGFYTYDDRLKVFVNNNLFGEIIYNDMAARTFAPAIKIYLNDKQQVFNLRGGSYNGATLYNSVLKAFRTNQTLKLIDGRSFNSFIQFNESCFARLGIVHNNQIYFDGSL